MIGIPEWVWPMLAGGVVALSAAIPFARARRLRTVFVSYRRSDTGPETDVVSSRLAQRFGRRRVFHDVRSIRPGENFRQVIARTLRRCDAAIVMIGPDWATCRDAQGRLRLHEADDLVRAEVAAALESNALVVPVLVRGAPPPAPGDLPADLAPLVNLQVVRLATDHPTDSLGPTLQAIAAAPVRRTPWMLVAAHLAVVLFPLVFYRALLIEEFTTSMAIVLPGLAASAAVAVTAALRPVNPARVRRVTYGELFVPLAFVVAVAALVLLKAFNVGIASFETFKLLLTVVEIVFVAYTAVVLSSLFENRRRA